MAINAKKQIRNARNVEIVNIGPSINTKNEESRPVVLPNGKGMFFTSRREVVFLMIKTLKVTISKTFIFLNTKTMNGRLLLMKKF